MNKEDIQVTVEDFQDPVMFQVGYLNQIPHDKQKEVLLSPQKNKIIVCGRRSGKSQLVAGELIRGAVLKIFPKQILIAPTFKQAVIVFDKIIELMNKAEVFDTDIEKVQQSPHPKVIFKNGSSVYFGSADNPDSLRGEAYDRVFKDESAFIKKGADNAIKPLTYDKGAPTWETTSPMGKGEVWEKWQRGMAGDPDYGCFHFNYKDNPYLSDDGKKDIERDIEEYGEDSLYVQCEIYGNFVEDRDVYFKRELVEGCVDENMPNGFYDDERGSYFLGVDVAGEGEDESVFVTLQKDGEKIKVVDISNYERNKPREVVGMVKNLDEKYHYNCILMDKTGIGEGPEDWLKETLGDGIHDDNRVEGIRFTQQLKIDMYSNLKKLFNQRALIIPKNKKLIFQLCDFRYEITSTGGVKLHHSDRGHDDYCDALALACWAVKNVGYEGYKPSIA